MRSIRRRKNCGCCDVSRTILYALAPCAIGGAIDWGVYLGGVGYEPGVG